MPWRDGPAQPLGGQIVRKTGTTYAKMRAYSLAFGRGIYISRLRVGFKGRAQSADPGRPDFERGPVFPPNVGPKRFSLQPARTHARLVSEGGRRERCPYPTVAPPSSWSERLN